jgi:D-alanyl-D-alanine carboxypeptidase
MAFLAESGDRKYFYLDRFIGGNNGIKVFVYISRDDLDGVLEDGYFAFGSALSIPISSISTGDRIDVLYCSDRDDYGSFIAEYRLVVVGKTATALEVKEVVSLEEPGGLAPRNVGFPTVSGTVDVGETLTGGIGGWSQELASQHWQWFFDGRAKAGADQLTYVVEPEDVGKKPSFGAWGYSRAGATFAESDQAEAVTDFDLLDVLDLGETCYVFDLTRPDTMFTDAGGTLPADGAGDEIQALRNLADDSIEALTQSAGQGMLVYEETDGRLSARTTSQRRMVFDRALLPTAPPFSIFIAAISEDSALAHVFTQFQTTPETGNVQFSMNGGYSAEGSVQISLGRFLTHIESITEGHSPAENGKPKSALHGLPVSVLSFISPSTDSGESYTRIDGGLVDNFTMGAVNTRETRFGSNTFLVGSGVARMYAVIILHYVPTDDEIVLIERWLKTKADAYRMLPRSEWRDTPTITAEQSVTIDVASGEILIAKDPFARNEMGSITKLMSVHLALNLAARMGVSLSETQTISANAAALLGSGINLLEGDIVSIDNLIDDMALPSSNQASRALSEFFGNLLLDEDGTPSADPDTQNSRFVQEMNREAVRLGLTNTSFGNAHGLDTAYHFTCARDYAVLAMVAANQTLIRDKFTPREVTFSVTGLNPRNITIDNDHEILLRDEVVFGKTGGTPNAGRAIVFYWTFDKRPLVTCTLQSDDDDARIADNNTIIDYVKEHFTWSEGRALFTA